MAEAIALIEAVLLAAMGMTLVGLSYVFLRRDTLLGIPATVGLLVAGILAELSSFPRLFGVPENLEPVLGMLEALFFAALSVAILLFAIFLYRSQARELATLNMELAAKGRALAQSNEDLGHFAYVASHDLREPLRMVRSYMRLLHEKHGPALDAEAREFIGFAVDGAERLDRLIVDLLQYSRVGTQGRPLAQTDAEAALAVALKHLELAIEEAGAQVTSGPLPMVEADEGQFVQVFQNLIGNAIKYRGEAPPVIEVTATSDGDEVTFHVKDNGIGIPPAERGHLFQIFHRLHARDEYEGTGIGLAVVKRIVERHGGRVWVESEGAGKGATFSFTLRAAGRPGA